MRFECPECHEADVAYVSMTEDAKSELRCKLCDHRWLHGGAPKVNPGRRTPLTYQQAFEQFPTDRDASPDALATYETLRHRFLLAQPNPEPEAKEYWARYQAVFSADGLERAQPAELKSFANSPIGAGIGNMSVFNKAWNDLGEEAAATKFRSVVDYLLRGPTEIALEDRLEHLIDPTGLDGMTGFRESMLTKVLCVMEPSRFLPILIYSSPRGGKREIAKNVFGLSLPAAEATSMTRGRLACWSNDLLTGLLGDGFVDLQHASQFLWWANGLAAEKTNL